jgi:hypothetical protein
MSADAHHSSKHQRTSHMEKGVSHSLFRRTDQRTWTMPDLYCAIAKAVPTAHLATLSRSRLLPMVHTLQQAGAPAQLVGATNTLAPTSFLS